MASQRKIIRKKIQQILLGKTDVKDKVFTNQATASWDEDLPVIIIYPKSEVIEKFNQAPRELKKDVDFVLEVIAKGPEILEGTAKPTVEDQLDDILEQIECALSPDQTLDGVADDHIPTNIEFEYESAGSNVIGHARVTYTVTYVEHSPKSIDKQAGISDFKTVVAEYKVGHHDSEPDPENTEAKDNIDIPQT